MEHAVLEAAAFYGLLGNAHSGLCHVLRDPQTVAVLPL